MQTYKFCGLIVLVSMLGGCTSKAEKSFVAGCESNGAPAEVCSCTYAALEDEYSESEIEKEFSQMEPSPRFGAYFVEKTLQCARENL